MSTYKYVNYVWDDAAAAKLDPVGRLVYRSNSLGGDQRITNTGGGNTSSKIMETDPLTGGQVEVLWVKGSGGDLRTSKRENFSSLYQDKLIGLQGCLRRDARRRDSKTRHRGRRWSACLRCTPRSTSTRAPALHRYAAAQLSCTFKHVDHTHPNAAIAIAASRRIPPS